MDTVEIECSDGFVLAGTLARGPSNAAVLIAPAMAVKRQFYHDFCKYLQGCGVSSLVIDYRGIGGSAPDNLRGFDATLEDWGTKDLSAAWQWLQTKYQDVYYVGHSVGGQLMPLVENLSPAKALLVASQSGYWKLWSGLAKVGMFALWHSMPALTKVGFLPMRVLRQGENVPAGVAKQWAAFGKRQNYIASHPKAKGTGAFANVDWPVVALAIEDDGFAPRRAVESLVSMFPRAQSNVVTVPAHVLSRSKIGHFGLFRDEAGFALMAHYLGLTANDSPPLVTGASVS